jgi:HEAT repeat protein
MHLFRYVAILGCSICLGLSALAQTNPPKQQQPNNTGVVGDTGREADQPVAHPAKPKSSTDSVSMAWQMLETGATDSKEQVQVDALSALGTLSGFKKAETILQDTVKDKNIDVRLAAVAAAGTMQDRNMIPALRQALDDPAPEVTFAAAVALWKIHDQAGIDVLYGILAGERKPQGSFVKTEMHQANKDLHDPATLARIGALQGAYALLGPFGIGLSAARLAVKSNDTNSARILTANLLAQDHSEQTKKEFIAALSDNDYFVRAASARSLGSFHGKDVSDALFDALSDDKPAVRFMAAASYIRSSQPSRAATGKNVNGR